MSFLTESFDDSFVYNGKVYHVDMTFDNILLLFEMFNDKLLNDDEKPLIALEMLIQEKINFKTYEELASLYLYLIKEFLNIDLENVDDSNNKLAFDFFKDAELIYASFLAVYKIDLFEQRGKLHWKKFIALLSNLDDNSKLKQVIGIRTMKVPAANESSQEYRDHIIKMKQEYSLDDRTDEEKMQDTFSAFAKTLK